MAESTIPIETNSTNGSVTSGANETITDANHTNDSGNNPETTTSVTSTSSESSEKNKDMLERLARQVEYYFSTANLEKDTYLSTLRSLNDGYVPLAIISKFGKVKALAPTDSLNAVRRAAIGHSDLLEVVHIDTETGKRVDEETVATSPEVQTVEAVGPKTGEPIPMSCIVSNPIPSTNVKSSSTSAPVQNTLIIREVPEGIEESHIRELFTFEKCPQIQSMHLDVANCWFVTLDTTSKDDMIHVMLELRTKKFPSGESVKARLKSAVVITSDISPREPRYNRNETPVHFGSQIQGGNKRMGQGNNGKKRKNGANKGKNNAAQNKNTKAGKNAGSMQRRNNNANNVPKQNNKKNGLKQDEKNKAPQQPPPSLGEDHFPSLCNDDMMNKNKIEVEKLPEQRPDDEMDKARTSSDSASTATTTSSSSSSKIPQSSQQVIGGYAAALLKAAPPMKPKAVEEKELPTDKKPAAGKKDEKKNSDKKAPVASKDKGTNKEGTKKNSNKKVMEGKSATVTAVAVEPPTWGGGRSFADVLRKENAAVVVAAAPQKSS